MNSGDEKSKDPVSNHVSTNINDLPPEFSNTQVVEDTAAPDTTHKKKLSLKQLIIIILGVILAIPVMLIIVIFVIVSLHDLELNRLKKETTSLFQSSSMTVSNLDCHDAEFLNQCSFKLSAAKSDVTDYLRKKGFTVHETHMTQNYYTKGKLVVSYSGSYSADSGQYTSYYSSN